MFPDHEIEKIARLKLTICMVVGRGDVEDVPLPSHGKGARRESIDDVLEDETVILSPFHDLIRGAIGVSTEVPRSNGFVVQFGFTKHSLVHDPS